MYSGADGIINLSHFCLVFQAVTSRERR